MFRDTKPVFGQSSTSTSFGGGFGSGNMNSPFGQSTFGKTTTSGFTAPAFGSASTSLFGAGTSTSTGLFGGGVMNTPVFGQAPTTQSSAFGFGANTSNNTLFGNQPNANTSLFGNNATSAFGQNKPAFGSFTSPSTGLFGQPPQTQTTLFGQPAASSSSGLFGGFGNAGNQTLGTPIKFVPGTGTDTMPKNGTITQINTRHHCITCMKEYETKSLEELRLEDYLLNRKGPQQATQQTGLFGANQTSLFGSSNNTSAGSTSLFSDNKPLFSGGFGSNTGVFGSTNQQAGSIFSKPGGFGAATTTTASGFSFNTTTAANPFGGTSQTKPFGSVAPQSNLFGSAQPQTPAFGQTTGFGGFGSQPNQSIGLFQSKSPFMGNTTSTGFTFGQNTPTNQTTNLFGKPATGTAAFGSTGFGATSGFGSTNMFGNNQSTSLFNQSSFGKPSTSGFTFGSQTTPATSGLGSGLNLGGQSLFGSTTNKPGGLFGSGTGMFGSGSGAFGTSSNFGLGSGLGTTLGSFTGTTPLNQSQSQQGNVSVHEQILALASMPFGDTPLFRNLLPASSKSNDMSKPASPAPHKIAQKSANISNQYKVSPRSTTKIRVKPVSATQLSKKALFDGLDEDVPAQLENFSPQRSTKRLVLKTKPVDTESISRNTSLDNVNPYRESDKENSEIIHEHSVAEETWLLGRGSNSSGREDYRSPDTQSPRKSSDLSMDAAELRMQKITKSSLNNDVTNKERSNESSSGSEYFNVAEDSQDAEDTPPTKDQPSHPSGITLTRVGYYTIPSLDDLASLLTDEGKCIVDNFTVGREGYGNVYFPDSFDVGGLNLDEIVHFRHKEVNLYPDDEKKPPVGEGLNRRAQVTLDRVWPIDKSTHEPITNAERLQEMRFEDKLQRVCAKLQTRFLEYRPQTGSWVFKVEHFSKYGLSDSDEEETLPAGAPGQQKPGVSVKPGAPASTGVQQGLSVKKIISKDETTGLIGSLLPDELGGGPAALVPVLLDDDHDMEDIPKHPLMDFAEGTLVTSPTVRLARELGSSSHKLQLMKASFFMEDDISPDLLEISPYENHLLSENIMDDVLEKGAHISSLPERKYNILRSHFSSPQPLDSLLSGMDSSNKLHRPVQEVIIPPVEHPKSIALKYPHRTLHWSESSSCKIHAKSIMDLNIFKGHGFRVGWGVNGTFMSLTTQQAASTQPLFGDLYDLESFTRGRHREDNSSCIVQRLRVMGGGSAYDDNFCESVEGHLIIQLNNSEVIEVGDIPLWTPSSSVNALHAHCSLAGELAETEVNPMFVYARQVWELCVALWGKLPSLDNSEEAGLHHTIMVRREAVSEWFESVIIPQVRDETADILGKTADIQNSEHHIPAVLAYLSARNLKDACEQALKKGDYYTVMLLSQISGSQTIRQLVNKQLLYWEEVHADKFINKDRLKMFMLVAGIPLFSSTHGTINVCEGLEWKRCFALHLWYICSPVASVIDALEKYEDSFNSKDPTKIYARHPDPPYIDIDGDDGVSHIDNEQRIYDLCYHLLKLYSSHSYPLDKLLNPATHTADPLDYRLSWLIFQVLFSLGYSHLSEYSSAHLHTSFALQLESQGLWHWAIFVLLHLRDAARRKATVLDMLGRHVELSDNDDYLDKEDFLIEKLKIPPKWIYEAKATLASVQLQYSKAAWYLIRAGHVNEGHEIIMKHIAADAIINENYEYLQRLLEPLIQLDPINSVSGWNRGGQILWDYIQVVSEIKTLVENPTRANNYQFEKLHPLLTGLCQRINLLPCPTAKDRLCQSEIALRTAHLVRNVLQLQKGENMVLSQVLAHLINQLPLPEDYTCDELNQVIRAVVEEFVEE